MRPASTTCWNNGRTVKSSIQSRKKKWIFVDKKRQGDVRKQTSMCEIGKKKKKQKYEDARKMYRTQILVKKFRKMEKTTFGWP